MRRGDFHNYAMAFFSQVGLSSDFYQEGELPSDLNSLYDKFNLSSLDQSTEERILIQVLRHYSLEKLINSDNKKLTQKNRDIRKKLTKIQNKKS
jgi:hypothetical protein